MKKVKTKNSRVIERNKADYNENLVKGIKIFGILILILVIIYIGTAIVNGEIKFKNESEAEEDVLIQNEEILAGSTFMMSEKDYIVLYYDYTKVNAGVYDMLYSNYNSSQNALPKMYKVDLSKGFNKSYLSNKDELNENPNNASELELKNPTLIRIKNNKVVKFVDSEDEIKKYIEALI